MNTRHISALVLLSFCLMVPLRAEENSQTSGVASELEKAKARVVDKDKFKLRYKYDRGEVIRWKVVHLATTETKIQGNSQSARSRASSVKVWTVEDVNDNGNMTLTHSVDSVDMWQKMTDRPEIRYNSETDETAPPEYRHVAKTLSRPLTTVTIQPDGTVVDRESDSPEHKFGVGNMVMRLPEQPIAVGSTWFESSEIRVRLPDKRVKRIKTRKLYTLDKVQTGVATISVKTEVLTPVHEAQVKAGLIQQLTEGEIKFDIDAGRVLSKQLDWDETVVGFNGADSMLKYLARITEDILPSAGSTADKSQPAARSASADAAEWRRR
jgi:hypothetical protein